MQKKQSYLVVSILSFAWLLVSCGSLSVKSTTPHPTTGPSSDTARIFFVYPQGFPKASIPITENDNLIGYLKPKSYFMHEVKAGNHLFMMIGPYNTDGMSGDFQGGKTYYVHVHSNWASKWKSLTPGTPEWNDTLSWIAGGTMRELDHEKASSWNEKYRDENAARLARLKSGEGKTIIVGAGDCE